jgi:hypothetical protein
VGGLGSTGEPETKWMSADCGSIPPCIGPAD